MHHLFLISRGLETVTVYPQLTLLCPEPTVHQTGAYIQSFNRCQVLTGLSELQDT
jgi:hypothetical protein